MQRIVDETARSRPAYEADVVSLLQGATEASPGFVFTDRPYYAFQAGMLVPPEMAAFTRKRYQSGQISDPMLISILSVYAPEHVLLARFRPMYGDELLDQIERTYLLLADTELATLYTRPR